LENSAVELLVENGFDKRYGARALKRAFRQHIEVPLAELVMEQGHRDQRVVYVADSPDRKRVVIAKL
jgi:ATP-dependent Clp protease ATP-binding subunit ClpA